MISSYEYNTPTRQNPEIVLDSFFDFERKPNGTHSGGRDRTAEAGDRFGAFGGVAGCGAEAQGRGLGGPLSIRNARGCRAELCGDAGEELVALLWLSAGRVGDRLGDE